MYELIEIDPATGEEELHTTGPLSRCEELAEEHYADTDEAGTERPTFKIQKAA